MRDWSFNMYTRTKTISISDLEKIQSELPAKSRICKEVEQILTLYIQIKKKVVFNRELFDMMVDYEPLIYKVCMTNKL